jgi:spermidine/putrescine transport system permease protein
MQRTARSFHLPSGIRLMDMFFSGWSVVVFIFLYVPILLLVGYSFNNSRLNILWEGFTLRWYGQLWENQPLIQALKNSLIVAVFASALSVAFGTLGAWLLYRYRFPAKRAIQTLIFIPMVIPEIIMGISLMIFFTAIAFDFGYRTIIISHVTFSFPFVLVAVQARLAGVDPFLEEAAMDLGATPMQAFWKVMVPYMLPAIVSGALMSFTLSLDELIVTYFTMSPGTATLPIKVFGMAKVGLNPMLNAVSTIFILATVAFVLIAEWIRRASR